MMLGLPVATELAILIAMDGVPVCCARQLATVGDSQLGEGTAQVALHGRDRDEKPFRNLNIGQVLADQRGHLLL